MALTTLSMTTVAASVKYTIVAHFSATYVYLAIITYIIYRIFYRLILYPYLLSPLRSVPGPPLGNPLLGQYPVILKENPGIPYRKWIKQYGPVLRVTGPIGMERLAFVKPEALQRILVSDWLEYPRPGYLRKLLGLITGHGLLTVTGDEHKQMRKAMNPAFSLPNLMAQTDMYYDSIEGLIDIMRSRIDNEKDPQTGTEMLMYEWMSKVTLDIICETAFGYKADSLHNPHNELAEAYENLLNQQSEANMGLFALLMLIPFGPRIMESDWGYKMSKWVAKIPLLAPAAILIESMYRIRRISALMLKEKIEESVIALSDTDAKRDIMSLLVRARKMDMEKQRIGGVGDGYAMSDREMMDQVLTFLGAGHETTASGLAWALWLLANDKASQTRLREEVGPALAVDPRLNYRALKSLEFLDCVIMESLRVMPPVPMTPRKAAKTDYIDGVLVPKGTIVVIPIFNVNTWKQTWGDDAEEFKPARWLDLPKTYNPTFSMLSFIAGPHGCIGKTMAIVEMKAVLAALIANFEFEPAYAGQVAQPTAAITMKPKDGMPLRVRRVSGV